MRGDVPFQLAYYTVHMPSLQFAQTGNDERGM